MNTVVRHSTALINLAFGGLSAALVARGAIMIAVGARPVAMSHPAVERPGRPGQKPELARKLPAFEALAQDHPEEPGRPNGTAEAVISGGVLVPLNADLVGVVFYDRPTWSLAHFVVNGDRRGLNSINPCVAEAVVPCHEVAPGYTLMEIQKKFVKVRHDASGQLQQIKLSGVAKRDTAPVAAAAPEGPSATEDNKGKGSAISKLMDGVKQTGSGTWEAPPGMRDEVLGRLSEVAMEGRWLPYFENGKISGFKLAQTVANSAFDKIGLKSGDIIKSVNGYDISSPDKILDVFTRLRDARDVSVDIQRGDKNAKSTLKYTIN
jgi:hypothetical protein